MSDLPLKSTPLEALHIELGGKMVPFAGYNMPVQYPAGIKTEHLHTREAAGLFDVSHMGQVRITGEGIAKALEALVPVDCEALAIGKQTYAVFTNEQGGIDDDLIITRWGENEFFLVVNAACKERDIAYLTEQLAGFDVTYIADRALVALQGPKATEVMGELSSDANALTFMSGCWATLDGVECYVTRSGYSGEDGFEISIPNDQADTLARKLLSFEQVEAIGLGARDTLRLEAGLCLYGHDLDTTTSPIEASLIWSISKSRRADGAKAGGFPGAERILSEIANKPSRKRVGLKIDGKAPVREGAKLFDMDGNEVGIVTSGGPAPSYGAPVAMGYVTLANSPIDTPLQAEVRGKMRPVTVAKTPFVPQRYYRG